MRVASVHVLENHAIDLRFSWVWAMLWVFGSNLESICNESGLRVGVVEVPSATVVCSELWEMTVKSVPGGKSLYW